jgi:hypothetical protein
LEYLLSHGYFEGHLGGKSQVVLPDFSPLLLSHGYFWNIYYPTATLATKTIAAANLAADIYYPTATLEIFTIPRLVWQQK